MTNSDESSKDYPEYAIKDHEVEVPKGVELQVVPADSKLLVAYTDLKGQTPDKINSIIQAVSAISEDTKVPILLLDKNDTTLENISDETLKRFGLQRIK